MLYTMSAQANVTPNSYIVYNVVVCVYIILIYVSIICVDFVIMKVSFLKYAIYKTLCKK